MKPVGILSASGGIDVLSPETEIQKNCVREAVNVVLHNGGAVDRRVGATKVLKASRPHSAWTNADETMTLFVADGSLYRMDAYATAAAPTATVIATGLWPLPARYVEDHGTVYVSAGKILRIDADGTVSTPGVCSLLSFTPQLAYTPTLLPITGGLDPGTYGVAITAVSARGEESGMSNVEWIEFDVASGIEIALPTAIPDEVVAYRIYRTAVNEEELRLAETITAATGTTTLLGGTLGRLETTWMRELLPAGHELAMYRGRLYSAVGSYLYYSDALNHGLTDARSGFYRLGRDITIVQPVEDGIYVGTDTNVFFLRGTSPKDFKLERKSAKGAYLHSSRLLPADMLDDKLIDTKLPCAVWLSPIGYQIGLPGGTVLSPQSDKILLSGVTRAPMAAFVLDGVKQLVSAVETVTLGNGGASDSTP